MKRATILVSILAFIIVIGGFVYFVAGVSATSAPIKKYQYSGSMSQLITGLRKYASNNPAISFRITDTTGSRADGYAIYTAIEATKNLHQLEYHLRCEESDNNSEATTTKIALVFAYDATNNSGGYQKNGRGVNVLVDRFDEDFLPGLKKSQNIKLSPIQPTFLDPLKHLWNGD